MSWVGHLMNCLLLAVFPMGDWRSFGHLSNLSQLCVERRPGSISDSLFPMCSKVEDMLKRSFAEHHAQKAQPDNLAQMEKAENAIKALQNKEWPTGYNMCSRSEMEKYHKQTMTVKEINERNNKQLLASRLN